VAGTLRFYGWRRSGAYRLISGTALTDGRLSGSVTLTISNQEPPNESVSQAVTFDIMGPGDVQDLKPGAVVHMMPPPGTPDHEQDKCVHVDLAAPDLPWRYTPQPANGPQLRPWIVLVVGSPADVQLQPGKRVVLAGSVPAAHDLLTSARWAHVQEDPDHPGGLIARLLCQRPLDPQTAYVAVVVPSFTELGDPAWSATTSSVTLPAYDSWQFSTGAAGDFAALAGQLQPGQAPTDLGRAPMSYSPLPDQQPLAVRGALAPIGGTDAPVPQAIADDVTSLTTTPVDPRRPVITVPNYGGCWVGDPAATAWGRRFRTDPRARGQAGLGAWAGIVEQEVIVEAAAAQAGAQDIAGQRIRHLTAGLAAARSLWRRRTPSDPNRRLTTFGPALNRMLTTAGTVRDAIAGPQRPLSSSLFSTAAGRMLRTGPARTAAVATTVTDPAAVIPVANTPKPLPDRSPGQLAHADRLAAAFGTPPLDSTIAVGLRGNRVSGVELDRLVQGFDRSRYPISLMQRFDTQVSATIGRLRAGQPVPYFTLLEILDPTSGKPHTPDALNGLLQNLSGGKLISPDPLITTGDASDLLRLGRLVITQPASRPSFPIDAGMASASIAAAIDPTVARPFIVDRVLSTITGLDSQPLAPPELCPDLDLPAWQFLRDYAHDWLLPGVDQLGDHQVIAVQTNPAFVDAFLVGINTQTTGELRFRNLPIVTGCTPLRQFWARTNTAAGSYDDDIVGVANWPATSDLGDISHQSPAAAASADLVVVMRTPLFRRYPRTLVYLTPAPATPPPASTPDWTAEPDFASRRLPAFQGSIGTDIAFFGFDLLPAAAAGSWVVLEEPSHAVRFFNTGPTPPRVIQMAGATDGAAFASAAFADPIRVMIRGDVLIPAGTP
jgi:hypothetical protein